MTLKKHACIFTQRPAKASFYGGAISRGRGPGTVLQRGRTRRVRGVGDSIVNGAGIVLIVVREDLLSRGGSLVVSFRRGGRVIVARCVDRAAGRRTARGRFLPQVHMSEYVRYDYRITDCRQLDHLRAAPRAEQRINLPDALDQLPPRRGRHGPQRRRG